MTTQYILSISENKVTLTLPKVTASDHCEGKTVFYFSTSGGIDSAVQEAAFYAATDYHDYLEGRDDKKE